MKITWIRWGDVIIDLGREMYIPLEITRAKVLYTDIHYIYGPFPIYFHALLYKIFGVHIKVLITCGIITTFLTAILLYKISKFFINPYCSSLVSLTFIFICAFGNYVYLNNYNFILPYTYTATYGILFSLAALYFFINSINHKKLKNLIFCSIFTSLALLCKIEIGVSLLITVNIALLLYPFYKKGTTSILISLSPIIVLIIIYSLFTKMDFLTLLRINYLDAVSAENSLFNKWLLGATNLNENIRLTVFSSLYHIFLLMCLLSFDYILNNLENNIVIRFFITFTIYLITLVIIIFAKYFINPYIQFRSLPIICITIIIFSLWKLFIKKERGSYIALFCIALFSILILSRTILRISAAHYGFYILIPGLISYYLFFFDVIPKMCQKFTKNGLYYLSISILFILLILNYFNIYSPVYKNRTLRIEGKRGSVKYLNNTIGTRYRELVNYLIKNSNPKDTLVVLPEGIDINFHTAMDNPIFYNTFLPLELVQAGKQEKVIFQLDKAKVDYIVIVQRDTTEYGPSKFGIDYGKEIFNWIKENYEIVKLFGPMPYTTPEFGIAVMKRKAD